MRELMIWSLILATISLCSSLPADIVDNEWNDFKLTHGKQYRSLYEEYTRKQIFTENFNKITEHNKLYDEGLVTYSLNINQFADLTSNEIRQTATGYRKINREINNIEIINFVPDGNVEILDEFDWREKGAVTAVQDQGHCGSCWAFAIAGALEAQHFLKTGKLIPLSKQNLIDCSTEYTDGCDGGDMTAAFAYVHDNDGIDSEENYPYEASDKECRYQLSTNVTSARGYGVIESGNEEHLKAAIATKGPVAVTMDSVTFGFIFYLGGILHDKLCLDGIINDPENDLDHAVLAVGYGTTADGEDYWILKNSWGTRWGEHGYLRLARNKNNHCGVASLASFPINY